MTVICNGCGKPCSLNQSDLQKIEKISDKSTYFVKLERFLCIQCVNKKYSKNGIELKTARESLNLDVDK